MPFDAWQMVATDYDQAMQFSQSPIELHPLMDLIRRDRVIKARRQTPEERFAEAMEMTDFAFEVMASSVKDSYPDADAQTATGILRKRLKRLRDREDRGIFVPAGKQV
ncbi:MAG TPA: hypothetical protein DIT13_06740 [Verrucomicrobiales bacterium]|nr:hypothetical protein [Verrucomicrobiales bacterium]HRJ08989.1 hypothetical protein [Prosthecobacter sp.]